MITNGLTPVFGSEPLSWGTFGVLFDPPRFGLFILSLPLNDALETHACLLQNTSWMLFCRLPSARLDVILSRLAPFCLFRGHKAGTDGSGEALFSKKMNLPFGLRTRAMPRMASATLGIVHRVNVLTI